MRYVGQGWEVPVTIEVRDYTDADGHLFRKLFDEQYEHFFGRVIDGLDVEIVSWSLRATSKVAPPAKIGKTGKVGEAKVRGTREIFDVQEGSFQSASIVARADMKPGDWVAGPAVITERETSTIITMSREVIMQSDGCLLIRVKRSA
jgi:N-methylhydantoinase A